MTIENGVNIVPKRIGFIRTMIVSTVLLGLPVSVLARGGGGGGGGHGGGGGGGGHFGGGGARGGPGAGAGVRGYGGGGYRGYGGGYRGYTGGRPGFAGRYGGYGWGYPGYYGGWGYPYYGTGLGLGLGLGLGYGLSSGYGYGGYGYGGYGGYGYPGYGYGSGAYSGANYYSANTAAPSTQSPPSPGPVVPASATKPTDAASVARSREFAERGEAAFKSADYEGAVYALRHAVVDDPQNPMLVLQLGQALFATGKFQESAGATQAAMHSLPKEEWGSVVSRYQELYGNKQDYTRQLRDLEKAVNSKPDDPALRFLAGYHYGYLGFLKQSIEQLDRGVQIESRDEMAKQLGEEMKSKLAMLEVPPAAAPATTANWIKSK